MSIENLKMFQAAVNTYGTSDGNTKVGFDTAGGKIFSRRIEAKSIANPQGNTEVRAALKEALTSAFGVRRLEELPPDVRKVLKIRDFKLSQDGEVRSTRPLTLRRIRAILGAVQKVASDATASGKMQRALENEFDSNFSEASQVEAALKRSAIAAGRMPMSFAMPSGAKVELPLAWLSAYTRKISSSQLAAKVDFIHDEIQSDIDKGSAIYHHLCNGRECVVSETNQRALRQYLAFAAFAAGKGHQSKFISVPDPNGMLSKFLADGTGTSRGVKANETITGSVGRLFIFSDIACPQATDMFNVQKDLERRYQKLESNPFASELMLRRTRNGNLSIAQMHSNLVAEMRRLTEVGDEELRSEALREMGVRGNAANATDFSNTKAQRNYIAYRNALNECLTHLLVERNDLDHPEARVADEIVLSDEEIAAVGQQMRDNSMLVRPNVALAPQPASDKVREVDSQQWRIEQIEKCGDGDFASGMNELIHCVHNGFCPLDANIASKLPTYNAIQDRPLENKAVLNFINQLDRNWIADFVWYKSCDGYLQDQGTRNEVRSGARSQEENGSSVWQALREGVLNGNIPASTAQQLFLMLTKDNLAESIAERMGTHRLREGFVADARWDAADLAASKAWGFGTYDIAKVVRFVEDCGYRLETISAFDLDKLSALAALQDFRLEEVATFIQRQTGKTPAEITQKEIAGLFRLKMELKLNDKGAFVKGVSGDVVSMLKGERLPSAIGASGKDVSKLLGAMRSLAVAEPGSSRKVEVLGRAVALRLTNAGTLVFCVDGFEFRAGKSPREFVDIIENDAVTNPGKFGIHLVLKMLPQIRGAHEPPDPVASARSRELCLRFLKGAAGIEPAMLSVVSTAELYSMAECVADGRYRLRSGELSKNAVKSMIEMRTGSVDMLASRDAIELCRGLESLRPGVVEIKSRAQAKSASQGTKAETKLVHELMADLVLDANPLYFDQFRGSGQNQDARTLAVLRRHVPAISACVANPKLLSSFPPAFSDVIGGLFGGFLELFAGTGALGNVPEEVRMRHIRFLLNTVDKPSNKWEMAVDGYLRAEMQRSQTAQQASSADKGGTKKTLSTIAGTMVSFLKGTRPAPEPVQVPPRVMKQPMLAALGLLARSLDGSEARIEMGVRDAMERIQETVSAALNAPTRQAGNEHPLWAQDFDEIVGNAMTDADGGYGRFVQNVLQTYFVSSSIIEQRQMFASLLRNVDESSSDGAVLGALFRGAGPLLQKLLQGLPPAAFGDDLSDALKDVKSNLQPIPEIFVQAGMKRIIDRSGGRIQSISVERSLGAASVGQAFLCRMVTLEHPQGEECVVKLLRPTVKTAIARERKIFEDAAASVPGMAKTFEGQLARILEELDFTLEATNIDSGRGVYEQPAYLRQKNAITGEVETLYMHSLHSMQVHPLVTPTMDCLVLKKAPGETYDRYMSDTRRQIEEVRRSGTAVGGRIGMDSLAKAVQTKRQLDALYVDALKRQGFLVDLTRTWVHEGMFGNGFYHGDLHAGNIMSDGKGLTVIDFGNATRLSELERSHVLRMVSAALVGRHDIFENSFKSLLSPEGRAEFDRANRDGRITRDLADILHKGMRENVGMRISASLIMLQRHGIEVPAAIYNFNQCQVRLGATVDEMVALIGEIDVMRRGITITNGGIEYDDAKNSMSKMLAKAVATLDESVGGYMPTAATLFRFLDAYLGGRNEKGEWEELPEKIVAMFADEWSDHELCQQMVSRFVDKFASASPAGVERPEGVAGGEDFRELFNEYMGKNPAARTLNDRIRLAYAMLHSARAYVDMLAEFAKPSESGRTVSFLDAVGSSITDSLYTVRTTLGNAKAVELMRDESAAGVRENAIAERILEGDAKVETFLRVNRSHGLLRQDVDAIRHVASRLTLPFDLPGIDGKTKWRNSEAERMRFYGVVHTAIKRILDDLQQMGVIEDLYDAEHCKNCVRIAMQYVVDRSGWLFAGFGGMSNVKLQEMLVEAGELFHDDDPGRLYFLDTIVFLASGGF